MKLRLARLWMPLDLILMAPDSTQRFVSVYSLTQGEKKKKKKNLERPLSLNMSGLKGI